MVVVTAMVVDVAQSSNNKLRFGAREQMEANETRPEVSPMTCRVLWEWLRGLLKPEAQERVCHRWYVLKNLLIFAHIY